MVVNIEALAGTMWGKTNECWALDHESVNALIGVRERAARAMVMTGWRL